MINEKRLIDTFCNLVAIDSPSHGERAMCDELIRRLGALGIEAVEDDTAARSGGDAGNLYAFVPGELPSPPLLFSTHMDTVPPARGKRAVLHGDGRITSDGTTVLGADDLAGVAAVLEALTVLREQGLPHCPLELMFDAAEETYGDGIRCFDFSRLRSREGYVLDLSGPVGGAANRAPTLISFEARFDGRAAHAAFSPENGVHAIAAAAAAVGRVRCGRQGDLTVNIGSIRGGTADNIVPDGCVVTGEVRSLDDNAATEALARVESAMRAGADEFGAGLTFTSEKHLTAYHTPEDHPVVERFRRACLDCGVDPDVHATYGGSDNNFLALHGLAGIVIAAGMNDCHSCGEYTHVDELVRAAEVVLALMRSEG